MVFVPPPCPPPAYATVPDSARTPIVASTRETRRAFGMDFLLDVSPSEIVTRRSPFIVACASTTSSLLGVPPTILCVSRRGCYETYDSVNAARYRVDFYRAVD